MFFILCCNFFLFSSAAFSFSVSIDVFAERFGVALVGGVLALFFGWNSFSVVLVSFLDMAVMLFLVFYLGWESFSGVFCVFDGHGCVVDFGSVCNCGVAALFGGVFHGGFLVSVRFGSVRDGSVAALFGGVLNGGFVFCGRMAFFF